MSTTAFIIFAVTAIFTAALRVTGHAKIAAIFATVVLTGLSIFLVLQHSWGVAVAVAVIAFASIAEYLARK
jgi:hypothetical protein